MSSFALQKSIGESYMHHDGFSFLKSSLYKYGSSLTKLPEYLASGKPVIYASDSTFQPINDFNAGISVAAEDPRSLAAAIVSMASLPQAQRDVLGLNGKVAANLYYEYASLAEKLIKLI